MSYVNDNFMTVLNFFIILSKARNNEQKNCLEIQAAFIYSFKVGSS